MLDGEETSLAGVLGPEDHFDPVVVLLLLDVASLVLSGVLDLKNN
jgi:hypothetical protein